MVSFSVYLKSRRAVVTRRALFITLVSILAGQLSFGAHAVESWEPVDSATIVQGGRIYVRGVGYYTDNDVSVPIPEDLSDSIRLVVTSSTHSVTNADGIDDSGYPYFDMAAVDETVRITFQIRRGSFGYDTALYQLVESATDSDGDDVPDDSDICPFDPDNDQDGDGICGDVDECPADFDNDADGDGICGDVDECPADPDNDADGDGICGDVDACPADADNDADGDGICGDVDACPADADNDADGDGICGDVDICPDDPADACESNFTVSGLVFGNGASVANGTVTIGTNTVVTSTDLAGEFSADVGGEELANDGIDDFLPVSVEAEGYASAYQKVIIQESVTSYYVEVHLQQVSETITEEDDLDAGVKIVKEGSPVGELTIPDEALPAGVTEVTGDITYLDPETDDILSIPGGDLLALPEGADPNTDTPVLLETFGMMEFDLEDQNGNPINELGGEAEVCMKATTGLSAGDIIPLWYFDEEKGLWIEEGEGEVVDRDGQLMICGGVTHFTWWNYDQPISTHSCLHFDIVPEEAGTVLDGLEWYGEGVTYAGTSPARVCNSGDGSADFDSLTVKISSDPNNPEQIRVYSLLGGATFYLMSDGDGTYSLTQEQDQAEVFDTPVVNGSCLTNVESGTCMPLDHAEDGDGILPLSTDINLPPVITEFSVASLTVLPGQEVDVQATVTDPEGTLVQLSWDVECGYYGSSNGEEFMTPEVDSGPSGQLYTSVMTAPTNLDYPIETCRISLTATDADGVTGSADTYVTVGTSFEFIYKGTLYGVDGQPLPDHLVRYNNFYCEGQELEVLTDGAGYFEFPAIDISQCIVYDEDFGSYISWGYLGLDFVNPADGLQWSHTAWLYYYNYNLDSLCMTTQEGVNVCSRDVYLPTQWAPLSGTFYHWENTVPGANVNLSVGSYGYGFGLFGSGSTSHWGNLQVEDGGAQPYSILVPVGTDVSVGVYHWFAPGEFNSMYITTQVPLAGAVQDIGDATVPLMVTVYDPDTGDPVPGVEVTTYSFRRDPQEVTGVTDEFGEYSEITPLDDLRVTGTGNGLDFSFYQVELPRKDEPVYLDIFGNDQCTVTGTVLDRLGQPVANQSFVAYQLYGPFGLTYITDFSTDEQGRFVVTTTPSRLILYSEDFSYWLGDRTISHCRDDRELVWDVVLYGEPVQP